MNIQDFIFYPHNDMENSDVEIVEQYNALINANNYTEAIALLEENNYVKGIRAALLNNLRNKIRNLQDYTASKEVTEEDYFVGGIKEYLGEYLYSAILSTEQWKYGNVFYCDFSSVFSSTSPNKGYWMITNENVSDNYKNYRLDLTTEEFIIQPTIYQEEDLYYVEFYCDNSSANTAQFLSQHIGEEIFTIADKVDYTYDTYNNLDYYNSANGVSMIIKDSNTLKFYSDNESWLDDLINNEEPKSTFSFYTFTGNSIYPLHYYFSNSVDSNEYIKYLENYDPNSMITYSEGVYSSTEATLTEMEKEIFWNKIIEEE